MNEDELGQALREELHGLTDDLHPTAGLMTRIGEIPNRGRRRPARSWVIAPVGAAVIIIIIIFVLVVIAGASTPPAALAFTLADGKVVRVTVQDIRAVRPANQELMALGRVRAVSMTAACRTPTDEFNYLIIRERPTPHISLGNPPTGYSGTEIVAAKPLAGNRIILAIGTVAGTVPSCVSSRGTGPGFPGFTSVGG